MIEIYNCDCRDLLKRQDIVEKKICIVTDPPFNVGYKYNSYKDNLPHRYNRQREPLVYLP